MAPTYGQSYAHSGKAVTEHNASLWIRILEWFGRSGGEAPREDGGSFRSTGGDEPGNDGGSVVSPSRATNGQMPGDDKDSSWATGGQSPSDDKGSNTHATVGPGPTNAGGS